MSHRRKFIRASEIGEYIFCARAWRLRIDGHAPTLGGKARETGERWHRKHGEAVLHVRKLRRLASYSALLAIALGVLTLLLWWWR